MNISLLFLAWGAVAGSGSGHQELQVDLDLTQPVDSAPQTVDEIRDAARDYARRSGKYLVGPFEEAPEFRAPIPVELEIEEVFPVDPLSRSVIVQVWVRNVSSRALLFPTTRDWRPYLESSETERERYQFE